MRRSSFARILALPLFLIGLAACGENPVEPTERFDLTFSATRRSRVSTGARPSRWR